MRLVAIALLLLVTAALPDTSLACERCFGAGVDAPAVRAVSASMLVLFGLIAGVFGGIISFFHNMSVRASALAQQDESSSV